MRRGEIRVVRSFPHERVLAIACRSLHLVGAGAVTGALLLDTPWTSQARVLLWLAVVTGVVLQLDDIYRYGAGYFATAMCWLIVAKVALLAVAFWLPPLGGAFVVLAVLASGVVSHMSGAWRHQRLLPWG